MYVTTFYSYKGGVGRTMALVNVAHLLASAGKRVLAVDFDLEAPGLSSYGPFRAAGNHPGLVEYVHAYLDSDIAPDVNDYILECRTGDFPIWVLPAGQHTDPGYAGKYSSINWQELYREHDGFLLFEDLRQQWERYGGSGFDYVLIDSRTGHTDIGGICTRQLPDAVVIQFIPTQQNLDGLRPIVDGIKREGAPVRRNRVRTLYCPSNLPEGDDQELILKRALETAQRSLNYKQAAAEIYHYGAMDLLEQPVYVATSPQSQSRLAAEYVQLHNAILEGNLEDRDGALIALIRMREEYQAILTGGEKAPDERVVERMRADIDLIAARFPRDVEIAWHLAALAGAMTRPEDELTALNVVVETSGTDLALALLRRSRARASLDDTTGAIDDLERLLTAEGASAYEVAPASALLRRLSPRWRDVMEHAARNPKMAANARSQIIQSLLTERKFAPRAVELARISSSLHNDRQEGESGVLPLSLIADGQFQAAMTAITPERGRLLLRSSMSDAFNYGLSEWALTGKAPEDLLGHVLNLQAKASYEASDANGLQCFALCHYLLGRPGEAINNLQTAQLSARRGGSVFSCWRYLTVTSKDMLEDLDEMNDAFARGVVLRPPTRDGLKVSNFQ